MKPRNLIIIFTALCLLIALLLSISFFSLIFGFVSQDRIAFGLRFDDQPLTGLTREEAQHIFEKNAETMIPDTPVFLTDGAKLYPIRKTAIDLNADTDAAIEKAYSAGRGGNRLEQIADALDCAIRGRTITLKGIWDVGKLQSELEKVTASIERQPIEGCVWLEPTGIHHRPPAAGLHVDTESLEEELTQKLTELRVPHTFQLPIETIPPKIPADAYTSIDAVLSEYSTFYNPSSNRGENIAIAASKLNQVIIQPGEEFSFNSTVGGRVISEGYLDAPVIIDGKVEQDIGGGVCQVSSTLYNAVLLAGLTPTMRTSHFYPSGYVPAGLDATVADGQIDFCFRNDLPHSVYLLAGASGGTLTVTVLGSSEDARSYGLTTEITGPNPTVDVYRVTYENGEIIESEFLHTDNYDIQQENTAH